jgi:ankyrin repeat protein
MTDFEDKIPEESFFAASKKGNVEEMENSNFKDADKGDSLNNTPLHYAASGGHLDACKFLIEKRKVNINKTNNEGDTPLHKAAWKGELQVVKYLIEKDCKMFIKNLNHKRPVDLARHLEVKSYLQSFEEDENVNEAITDKNNLFE